MKISRPDACVLLATPCGDIGKIRYGCCGWFGLQPSSICRSTADTAAPIRDLAPLLRNVPPSRLFDEMLKLLLSGHAFTCVTDLRKRGLHHGLLPMLDVILEQPLG